MIQARIGYRKARSPWMVQLTVLWMPSAAQNHWWGVGVKYDACLPANSIAVSCNT